MTNCLEAAESTFVLNGWAASAHAWDKCQLPRRRIFSYVEQLQGVVDAELMKFTGKVWLVGWSMGGMTALKLLLAHPDKIAGMVLVSTTPRMMRDEGWAGMSERRLAALKKGLLLTGGKGMFGEFSEGESPYLIDDEQSLDAGLLALKGTDLRSQLISASLTPRPVVIVHGKKDAVVPMAHAQYLAQVLPGAELQLVAGGEHTLPLTAGKLIAAAWQRVVGIEKMTNGSKTK